MDKASNLVGQIYDAVFDTGIWPQLLCSLADYCGVDNAALVVTDPHIQFSSVVTPRADPEVVSHYAERWWTEDPTAATTASMPVGRITSLADTGREKFFASRFYNDYWRHSGLGAERLASNLFTDGGGFSSIVLQAPARRDEIGADTVKRFSFFIPHLVRAVSLARNLQRTALETALLKTESRVPSPTSTVVVDHERRVLFADTEAERLFSQDRGIRVIGGRLYLTGEGAHAAFDAALSGCCATALPASRRITVRRSLEAPPYSVEVRPIRIPGSVPGAPIPAAVLRISNPELHRDRRMMVLQERFGLTPAEARLALEMRRGDGRAAAARRCGISINTARTHLTSIFGKTGVTRQAELIKVLLQL
ncbi:helix-turn-helix transcriptional regulator [Nitratireductor sp. B36]|uniref:helix-turn-helix transcriptional regulator n=1 Tax=Nitratireductor sp. B36 TaxID=2762059 RepID=UPI001E2CC795|nr:helix-turn-helix transcriptional regulator [Nitratireductor sp. B36]MCC5777995.1 helix-turn-helix transcriptional regulator [Nitratireductor sp. B36]